MNNEVIIGVLIMKKIKLFIMLEILCIGICGCGLTNINEQNMKQETNLNDENESVSDWSNESNRSEISQNQIPSVNGEFSWKWVIEPGEYQMISFANNGMILAVDKEGRYGAFDSEGEVVVSFCYDYISKFNYGIAEAELNGEAFYINEEGETLWDRKFDNAYGFQEEMGAVQVENLWGFVNLNGEMTIPCQYDEVKNFSEGLAAVKKNDKWGFIDKTGELFVDYKFDEVRNFQEGFSAVKMDGKWGFVDGEGRLAVECIYDEVKDFQEDHAAVMKDSKWGFVDNTGVVRINLQFDDAGNFSEGKAAVKVNEYQEGLDAWAYIDESGEIVIDYDHYFGVGGLMNYVGEFHNGIAFVSKEYYSIIDENGNNVFFGNNSKFFISSLDYNQEYDIIPAYIYADDAMKIRKYGLINLYGEQRLEPIFDFVGNINGKYVIVWDTADDISGYYTQGVIELVQ